ncbi:MAG: DUF1146 family protein [Bacilli bacterium]|nr:DUF1146 family protein [Bacilli bacterium]
MTTQDIISMWFFIMFLGLIPMVYRALMAIDFSKFFKYNSTWQIRLIVTLITIIISFLVSYSITYSLEKILAVITK